MNHQTPFERLQQLIRLEHQDINTLLAYGVGIGLMSLATPVAVQALVNTIAFGALFQPLLVLTLVLLVLVGFSNMLAGLQFYVVDMLQRRLFVRFFGEAAGRLQQAMLASRDNLYLPELANRFLDVVTLQKTASVLLLETLGYVLQTVIGMVLLAFYHPLLLAFDLFLIAMLAIILFVMGKNGLSSAIAQSKAKYAALDWLENIATNALLGKSVSGGAFLTAKTERIADAYLEASYQHFRVLARQNTGALVLHTLANTLLLGMGGWMVIEHQLSLGQLIAAELVVSAMIYGLTRLGKTLDNYYELLTSLDKIGHLLDLPQENPHGAEPCPSAQGYQVDVVGAALPDSPQLDVLRCINLHVSSGERLVISAGVEHGSLLDVLFGLRAPSAGYVCLNGQDIRDVNLRCLRETVALVRDAEIITASVIDNLALGRDLNITDLQQVLNKVGLLQTILNLPDGLETRLAVNGAPLSPEQCLRLTLARALLIQPLLLLLDGVLDRLDSRFLVPVLDSLFADGSTWTLMVSSQNAQVINRCSRHVQIVDGVLLEEK
ncbi:MAG: ABC transporter ATP-binding protein [Methylovulum sp.]|nr:ABC transporter ATP-binding protein [Methylovulum sp.]